MSVSRTEPGRAEYEANVARRPLYHDGTPRKTWEQLGEVPKWSWARESRTACTPDLVPPPPDRAGDAPTVEGEA